MSVGDRAASPEAARPVPHWGKGRETIPDMDRLERHPGGSATWVSYRCENKRWHVQRTSAKIVGGPLHGKYVLQVLYQPEAGTPWEVRVERTFTSRAASKRAEDLHYAKHSPHWARRNGHA